MPLPESVIVWICPVCSEYYASSNAGDLRSKFNTDIKGDITFTRARCPTPSCAASEVIRVPIQIQLPQQIRDKQLKTSEQSDEDLPTWFNVPCERCDKPQIITGNTIVCTGCGKITEQYG